jgi:hypothetical protein
MAKNKVQETETANVEAGATPESISLQDLQRGAFRGAELTQVGAIFDKLNAFLSFIAAQQQAAKESAEQSAESAE